MGLTGKAVGKNASRSDEIRKKKNGETLVALAGNPNVGKSTVFNILTGLRQHTGNWTGKTVATAVGYYKKMTQPIKLWICREAIPSRHIQQKKKLHGIFCVLVMRTPLSSSVMPHGFAEISGLFIRF